MIALVHAAAEAAAPSDAVVGAGGLSPSQYNVLRILSRAGEGGLTRTEIAERMVTRDPDMTRLLKGLESKKLVVSWRAEADARQRKSRVTDQGTALLRVLNPQVTRAAKRSLGRLRRERLAELIDILSDLS
ncbi:MAG: MarR family transcriptional regulator [Gemmatimonadota bacterium]|nr:MarR family transcriptional regulator [Gemmatimonadota bacterium]